MTTYKPYGVQELQALLQQAEKQGVSVMTRGRQGSGFHIDFQNWNKIREIDLMNLTVTVERAVTLGELEDAVQAQGLHMAAVTEDLRNVSIGDFFAEQMFCLTSLHHNQPRFQVLGLEVMLADGTLLSVAGKTVKNVTGYDMCRFYISNREQFAIPLVFTIKLVSPEPMQLMLEADLPHAEVLCDWVKALRRQRIVPQVCLYWNKAASVLLQRREQQGKLILVCTGSKQRLERELQMLSQIADGLQIGLQVCEQPEQIWQEIAALRSYTVWQDGLKVPSLQCPALLPALEEQQIGCWYNPMQGSLQLIPPQGTAELYKQLYDQAVSLGGAGNWYYMDSYGFAPETETRLWRSLKQQFDGGQRLNCRETGGGFHGTK